MPEPAAHGSTKPGRGAGVNGIAGGSDVQGPGCSDQRAHGSRLVGGSPSSVSMASGPPSYMIPLTVDDKTGYAKLPEGPGLGITIDFDKLAKVAADPKVKFQWPNLTLPDGSISFDLVRIPGPSSLRPFAIGAREVTWKEFNA